MEWTLCKDRMPELAEEPVEWTLCAEGMVIVRTYICTVRIYTKDGKQEGVSVRDVKLIFTAGQDAEWVGLSDTDTVAEEVIAWMEWPEPYIPERMRHGKDIAD